MLKSAVPMEAKYLTRSDLTALIKKGSIAILPIGSLEQHGPHLPLGTDTLLAEYLSKEVAKKTEAVIFPSLFYGYSWVWKELEGTVTLSQDTLKKVVTESVESLIRMGFKRIMLVNGHDSNKMALKYIVRDLSESHKEQVLNIFYPDMSRIYSKYMETPTWNGIFHADEFETSLMLAMDESLVKMDLAVKEYPEVPPIYGYDESSLAYVSKTGVYGDATKATKEKGEAMIREFVEKILNLLNK
jgi:creatinine amidohydrolase